MKRWNKAEILLSESLILSKSFVDNLIEINTLDTLSLFYRVLKLRIGLEGETRYGMVRNLLYILFTLHKIQAVATLQTLFIGKIEYTRRQHNISIAPSENERYNKIYEVIQEGLGSTFSATMLEGEVLPLINLLSYLDDSNPSNRGISNEQ